MSMPSHQLLNANLIPGGVYRRDELAHLSKAVDRDLAKLVLDGNLEKVAPGTYYKPRTSKYGVLPPKDDDLVRAFLRDDQYLMFSWNVYNSLGLGLTQLYNQKVVYNFKRHALIKLDGRKFDFRRPSRGFPKILSREYLLVDVVNNLKFLAEDSAATKDAIKRQFKNFDIEQVLFFAKQYGKVSTKKFFEDLEK